MLCYEKPGTETGFYFLLRFTAYCLTKKCRFTLFSRDLRCEQSYIFKLILEKLPVQKHKELQVMKNVLYFKIKKVKTSLP